MDLSIVGTIQNKYGIPSILTPTSNNDNSEETTSMSMLTTARHQFPLPGDKPPLPSSRSGDQFTLIELLTVIVIIAILAAILLPVLARAKYEARNVTCINNQKQICIGVLAYASDNDAYYPESPSEKGGSQVPLTVLAYNDNTKFDWRPGLTPYFGDSLKPNWICTLAPSAYENGAAKFPPEGQDIDKDRTVVTSYSHYYGRQRRPINEIDAGPWGAGGQPKLLNKGMRKVGQVQKYSAYWPEYQGADYSIMTSDVMWLYNTKLIWTHGTYGQTPDKARSAYGEYRQKFSPNTQQLDMNYSTDDGSVRTIRRIRYKDTRVNLSRSPGAYGWAWILPPPDERKQKIH